jgi:prepilin signal peptidase PulO-like enzyme (type II secretory pathway)
MQQFYELMRDAAIVVIGGILCIQDLFTRMVNLWMLIIFVLCCCLRLFSGITLCYEPFVVILLIGIIHWLVKKKEAFGLADYVVAFSTSFIISPEDCGLFLTLCGGIGVLLWFIQKTQKVKNVPFVSAMLIAAMVLVLFEN